MVRLWDPDTGVQTILCQGHNNSVAAIVFCLNGKLLSGSRDETLRLWDAATGKELRKYDLRRGWVKSLTLDREGKRVLTSGHVASLWDLDTGAEVAIQVRPAQRDRRRLLPGRPARSGRRLRLDSLPVRCGIRSIASHPDRPERDPEGGRLHPRWPVTSFPAAAVESRQNPAHEATSPSASGSSAPSWPHLRC